MKFCENFNAIITAKDGNTRLLTRTRCKMWTCAYCANINRKIWQARIIEHINQNKDLDWSWFTLTAHSKKRGAKSSIKNLRGAWDKLIKRIKRKYSQIDKIHYIRVFEEHKDGSYHLHCIISLKWQNIKIRASKDGSSTSYDKWLAKQARELKIGYYTHAANFDGKHAGYIAGYVVKYMTKLSVTMKQELGRIRHIQTTQGWTKFENENPLDWNMKSGYYEDDLIEDIKSKTKVLDIQTGQYVTYDDFLDTYIYPPEFDHREPDKLDKSDGYYYAGDN